ncbi:MAG: SDR family oxidoreductase, partial [Planctomycetota bacterium]
AASGIVLAIARQFAAEGSAVALLDLSSKVDERAQELSAAGADVGAWHCDVADREAVERIAAEIEARFGRVDHIAHAAAIGSGKFGYPFLNVDPEDWRRVYEVNVQGAVHVAHAFTPTLMKRGEGTFAFLSSVAALFGSPTDPPYSASKAALINFATCMARDLASHGVRVNSICPGMVKTPLNRAVYESWRDGPEGDVNVDYEQWAGEKVKSIVPLGRWQDPEDIADLCVFLASRRAKNITGQTINVDGGYVMR